MRRVLAIAGTVLTAAAAMLSASAACAADVPSVDRQAERAFAETALRVLDAPDTYAYGSAPEAEAWLETLLVGAAETRAEVIRDRRSAVIAGLRIPEGQEEAFQELIDEQTKGLNARLELVYEPVLQADALASRLAALYPAPDKRVRPDDLTLVWLRRRVLEFVRLHALAEDPHLSRDAVEGDVRAIFDLGPRTVGHAGHARIHEYVKRRMDEAGLRDVRLDTFRRAAPVDQGATVYLAPPDGEAHPLYAIWPNQAAPTMLPAGGIEGPLVYAGGGSLTEANGLDTEGAIVLLDFASSANWQWMAMLGARAVIFLHGPGMVRREAAAKFVNLPVTFPRFYADATLSRRLRELAERGASVRMTGTTRWGNAPCANVLGTLHATVIEDLHAAVRRGLGALEGTLPEAVREAIGEAVDPAALMDAPLETWPTPLVEHLLVAHLRGAGNPEDYASRLAETLRRVHVARQALMVTAPIDSMCTAPAAPHGADQSAALVGMLAAAGHLGGANRLPRDRTVIFSGIDSQFQSLYGMRSLGRILRFGAAYFRGSEKVLRFRQEAERLERTVASAEQMLQIARTWRDHSLGSAPKVEATLDGLLHNWVDYRRVFVVRQIRGESDAEEATTEQGALRLRLAYYKMAGKLGMRDLLAAAERVEAEMPPDRPAVLRPLAAAPDEMARVAEAIEAVNTAEELAALPAPTIRALRAALGDEAITATEIDARLVKRLETARDRLDAAREDEKLAVWLTGYGDRDKVAALVDQLTAAASAGKASAEVVATAEARLARLVREERYAIPVAYGLDLASHSQAVTFGEGTAAVPRKGLPGQFTWTVTRNLSQRLAESGRLINRVLDLASEPVFVDTLSFDVERKYTRSPETAPCSMFALADVTPYALVSTEDPKYVWNTPADVPSAMDFESLTIQVKAAAAVLAEILADSALVVASSNIRTEVSSVHGRVVKFDVRAGPLPNMPVEGALVWYTRGGGKDRGGKGDRECGGILSHLAVLADADGQHRLPFEQSKKTSGGTGTPYVWAYDFDYEQGVIDLALDRGESQTVTTDNRLKLKGGPEAKDLLVFDAASAVLFDPVDPRYLRDLQQIYILDGKGKSQPRHFSSLSIEQTRGLEGEKDTDANCAVVFVPPQLRVQVLMGHKNLDPRRLVLLGVDQTHPTGYGYPVGIGRLIERTPYRVARDIIGLNRYRLEKLSKAGIRSTKLDDLVARAAKHLERSEAAYEGKRYDDHVRSANAAWGFAVRAYPEVSQTANDAVFGVVFFLALLLPFAYFMERLTFGFKTAVSRIFGMSIWFLVIFLILFWVHPAFQISLTPLMILLAFLLLVLASVVLVLVSARFGEQVKKWRHQAGGIHSADVSRLSTTAVAFNLGIANLGKRKSRTVLTVVTLILLAFSVISFTSIQQAADHIPIELGSGAPYGGLLFRMPHWKDMPESIRQSLQIEFAGRQTLALRGWVMQAEGGWGAWGRHSNEIALVRTDQPDKEVIVKCLAGFEAAEKDLTGIDQTLTAGRWIRPDEMDVMLLPQSVARELGITPADVETGNAAIYHGGRTFQIIGIFDAAKADAVHDLNDESIAPVDYLASGSEGGSETSSLLAAESEVGLEQPFEHMTFANTAIIPQAVVGQMANGHYKSVAVGFTTDDPDEQRAFVEDLMSRLAVNVYAGVGDQRYLIRSVGLKTVTPDWTLVAPIILAVLIILNTMLGTVEERKGEIGMLGAVGLAPRHVAMLFFTEASVYANAGVVVGYLAGQVMAKFVVSFGWFEDLSLNYSSLAALFTAVLVAVIVLAATVYPARKAAALATPSGAAHWAMPAPRNGRRLLLELPFTLTRGNAIGMAMFLDEYFDSHSDPTSPDFCTQGLRTRSKVVEGRATLILQMIVFPAPYDLGVSQRCRVIVYPTSQAGVYGVRFSLRRLSSDESSWMRANARFMDLIRKQFLIWRTIQIEERREYIERGLRLFQ